MPELETVTLNGIEVFDVGTWNGDPYTDADLDGMIGAFAELRGQVDPPAKLGHADDQSILRRSGFPAAGWVENLYRQGTKLLADIGHVPKSLADLLKAGAYRKVSSEILIDASFNGKKYPYVFSGLAFLGEELPAVTTLGDIRDLYAAAHFQRGGRSRVITYARNSAPIPAPKEGHMPNQDEAAALVGQLERLRKGGGLASFAREALSRFRAWRRQYGDASHEQLRDALQAAIDERFGGLDGYAWIAATYDDRVIVQKGEAYYAIPYTVGADGTITFDESYEVEQTWTARSAPVSGGDLPAEQPPTPSTSGDTATAEAALSRKEKAQMKSIAKALSLKEDATEAEIVAAIAARPTPEQFSALQAKVTTLEERGQANDAAAAVDAAIRAKKVAPAVRDQMLPFARQDPKGFAALVEKAPAVFAGELGTGNDAPPARSAADDLNAKVVELMQADKSGALTFAKALDQASRANPELARKYVEERGSAARLS